MADDSHYTLEPQESDAGLGRVVLYDEAGLRLSYPEANVLRPCEACGASVIIGALEDGTQVALEQETRTYVLAWRQKTQKKGAPTLPTLIQSRGYPAHTCRRPHG